MDWLTVMSQRLLTFHVHQLFLSHLFACNECLLHCPINDGSLPCSCGHPLQGKAVIKQETSADFFTLMLSEAWLLPSWWRLAFPKKNVSSCLLGSVRQVWYLVVWSCEKFSFAAHVWIQNFLKGAGGGGWLKEGAGGQMADTNRP